MTNDRLLRKRDVAAMLNVSVKSVDRMRARGDLVAIKLGQGKYARVRFTEDDVRRLLEAQRGH